MTATDESSEARLVRVQAEAAAWIALLHSSERNADVEAGLKRWIAADPLHAQAWEAATDVWSDTEGLARRIPLRHVTWKRPRQAIWRPVVAITALVCVAAAGWTWRHFFPPPVTTAVGEQRTLNLEDGTRVALNTDTRIEVRYDSQTRTVILISGEAYFQVVHESRPFVVMAGDRKIQALGTAFTVRRDDASDDALTVTLIEGRVAVAPTSAPETTSAEAAAPVVLNAGQRLREHRHTKPSVDTPSIDKATGWMRGQLIFDHTPLREAAAEFSRYNTIKIVVASPQAAQIPIGGIFRIGDSRSFARAVAASYDLKVTQRGDELVLEPAQDDAEQ